MSNRITASHTLSALGMILVMSLSGAWAQPPADTAGMQRNLLELLQRTDQMERELRQLRGELEVMNHELDGLKRRSREQYIDLDRRLRELELQSVRPGAAPPPVIEPTTPPAATGTPSAAPSTPAASASAPAVTSSAAPTAAEKEAYRQAFNLLKEGRYSQSIAAFEAFLGAYPNSSYADNAQYWLGEANYVSRRYTQAAQEFEKVLQKYPQSPKVSDAMLKLGFTYYELKQWAKARSMLEAVVQRNPKGSTARLANTRLERMRKEGH